MALLILILIAGGYLLAAGTFASAGLERWATIAFLLHRHRHGLLPVRTC